MKTHIGNIKQTGGVTTTVLSKFRAVRSPITLRSIRGQGDPDKNFRAKSGILPARRAACSQKCISEVGF